MEHSFTKEKKVLFHTVFFILGISTAFFILGISFTVVGSFFNNKILFSRIAGIIIIILGLFQLEVFEFKTLQRERRVNLNLKLNNMNPIIAYVMGFTFSFAWTPCVGPALSSVLILASSAKSAMTGNILVLVYALGFVIPFLFLGLFTTQALNFIKKNKKIMKYTIKIGGIVMMIMGIMTFTGWLNNVTGYLSSVGENGNKVESSSKSNYSYNNEEIPDEEKLANESEKSRNNSSSNSSDEEKSNNKELQPAIDFTLTDQYGNIHKLSDYKGKTVFLNFWATWCPPCSMEMPHIEELYKEYNYNKDDIVILGVAQPGGREKDILGSKNYLNEQGHTFPVVFDESGEVFNNYNIMSLPTTFMINEEGKIYGYVIGALAKEQMKSIIKQTKENK